MKVNLLKKINVFMYFFILLNNIEKKIWLNLMMKMKLNYMYFINMV